MSIWCNPILILLVISLTWTLARSKLFTRSKPSKSSKEFHNESNEKYQKSGLKESESSALLQTVTAYLQTSEAYLDPTITLDKISIELKLYKHHVSQAINNNTGMNFYSFLNEFRMDKAIEALGSNHIHNKTIETISFECGFSSKSTFNNLFKKKFKLTPSQYLKKINQ
ncbi:MAG: AraC family transcriptional regulator [Cyclobacteriaceae bacterium]